MTCVTASGSGHFWTVFAHAPKFIHFRDSNKERALEFSDFLPQEINRVPQVELVFRGGSCVPRRLS